MGKHAAANPTRPNIRISAIDTDPYRIYSNHMTQTEMFKAFEKLGCTVRGTEHDSAVTGTVVTTYGVIVRLSNAKTGCGVTRDFRVGDAVDVAAVMADMRAELGIHDARERGALRRERSHT